MDFGSGGGGGGLGGVFGIYNTITGYKKNKAQEAIQSGNYQNQLNQANNNLAITQEQAPLVPQQAADSFAARGVGQSTFGNGMGQQWGQNPTQPSATTQYTNDLGQVSNAAGVSAATPAGTVVKPTATSIPESSGQGQPVGTGLKRAQDLASAMVSNATSQQTAAQNAYDQYQNVITDTRHQFYDQMAADYVQAIMGMFV